MCGKIAGFFKSHCCKSSERKCPMKRAVAAYKAAPKKTKIIVGAIAGILAVFKITAVVLFVRKKLNKSNQSSDAACNCGCGCDCEADAMESPKAE